MGVRSESIRATATFKTLPDTFRAMLGKLGAKGIVGLLALVAGIAVIALQNIIIAAGMALVVVGFVLTAWGLVSGLLGSFGMGAMMGGGFE
ncbi:hypothetical protein GCM10009000_045200 [Halobacterium noricense]|uniref:Uncharacterized protein n=2 Tax=Haladaptatus pallidirubidus TaxID=1008152 RepID=A0AAV3UEW8_9EURY